MMAKTILEKEKRIKVPKVFISAKFKSTYHKGNDLPRYRREFMSGEMYVRFDRAELEKRVDDFVPDIALYSGGQCLLVEIKVSHGVDEAKLQKIRHTGISVLEVDLSAQRGTLTENQLRELL